MTDTSSATSYAPYMMVSQSAVGSSVPSILSQPPVDKIAEALAKAQGEMRNATLNKINPHFRSKYADLAAIRDATIPALSKNGITMSQTIMPNGNGMKLVTRLVHISGQEFRSEYPLPNSVDRPQQFGSALTYAKRYSWATMCGISADEDDDGNGAEEDARNKAKHRAPPQPPVEISDARTHDPDTGEVLEPVEPYELRKGDEKDSWRNFGIEFASHINRARSVEEIERWMEHNKANLSGLAENAGPLHKRMETVVAKAKANLVKPEELAGPK